MYLWYNMEVHDIKNHNLFGNGQLHLLNQKFLSIIFLNELSDSYIIITKKSILFNRYDA